MKLRRLSVAAGLLVLVFLANPLLFIYGFFPLAGGWISAAGRLFGSWEPSTAAVIGFVMALAFLVTGAHFFFQWLWDCFVSGELPPDPRRCWRWKWTLCGFGIVGCAWLSVMAIVLIFHQTYWLRKSTTPWLAVSKGSSIGYIAPAQIEDLARREQWQTARVQHGFDQMAMPEGELACELFRPIWVEGNPQTLRAIILVPRRPLFLRRAQVCVLQPDKPMRHGSLRDLEAVAESFGIRLSQGGGTEPGRSKL